jgi:hypothetical protein
MASPAAHPAAPAELGALAQRVRPATLAGALRLPVLPALEELLPQGLPRGSVVAVESRQGITGGTSLALALAAGAAKAGAWVAIVGMGGLGLVAADGYGLPFERLVIVTSVAPGAADRTAVVSALVDGFDVVVLGPAARGALRRGDARRIQARLRERGSVLIGLGGDLPGGSAQVRLAVTSSQWTGLGPTEPGHLRARLATVESTGRGAASRLRHTELWLPGPDGTLESHRSQPTRFSPPAPAPASRFTHPARRSNRSAASVPVPLAAG